MKATTLALVLKHATTETDASIEMTLNGGCRGKKDPKVKKTRRSSKDHY